MGKNSATRVIAITGPTASGKSMLAKRLSRALGKNCLVLCQDDYYKDWPHLSKAERKKINFDDARAFDFKLFAAHVARLKKGRNIEAPRYCFKQSKRLAKRYILNAKRYIIIEGLMPFLNSRLRRISDLKIYIDIGMSESLTRRLKRDISERAETIESVCRRYFNEALPMQELYVEPQKKWADIVVDGTDCCNRKTINRIKEACLKNIQI